jgi:hypothetical protein
MAYIKTIPPRKATGQLAEAYRAAARVIGTNNIPKVIQVTSLRPATLKRLIRVYELSMWMVDQPRATLEMVAAAVSRLNNCHY